MDVHYHYTNLEGYSGILASKQIRPSLRALSPKDARYGDGQYVSDIVPGSVSCAKLSQIFLRIPFQGHRFSHFFAVGTKGLTVIKGREHVYVIPNAGPLDVSDRLHNHGLNPIR
jgi:hypothetical protein